MLDLSVVAECVRRPIFSRNALNQYLFHAKFTHKVDEQIAAEKVHLRMLFDAVNEALCAWKPLPGRGQTVPSRAQTGYCYQSHVRKEELNAIGDQCLAKIRQWGSLRCGAASIAGGSSPDSDRREEEAEDLAEEPQSRLVKIEAVESNSQWLWYEDNCVEVGLHLEAKIWEFLVEDAVGFLSS